MQCSWGADGPALSVGDRRYARVAAPGGGDMRTLDLEPHEYRVKGPAPERDKPHEPFWGPGAPDAIGYLIGLVLTVALLHLFTH